MESVNHNPDELDHLEGGHVLLPPDVLLVLRSHRGQHVVGVHEDVDESVEQAEESCMAARDELWETSKIDVVFV